MTIKEAPTSYTVTAGAFSGPFDLLLDLIEAKKLFINEISLSEVTNEYINYLKSKPNIDIGSTTGFVLVAATLLLIKSKSLLPNLELTEDEEGAILDLEARLKLYQLIKDIAPGIQERFGKKIAFYPLEREFAPVFSPNEALTKTAVEKAIVEVILGLPKQQFLPEITIAKIISLEEMIDSLSTRMADSLSMSFNAFAKTGSGNTKEEKMHTIVSFLAMLELVRGGLIDAIQHNSFEDITMKKDADAK